MQRRAELVQLLEEQCKHAQGLYDAIDAKIEMFDARTESIQVRAVWPFHVTVRCPLCYSSTGSCSSLDVRAL
jgi:hypothetical protein